MCYYLNNKYIYSQKYSQKKMSILNKYKRWVPMVKINTKNQMDMVLSQDHTPTIPIDGSLNENCLISYIDMENKNCIFGLDNSGETPGVISLEEYQFDGLSEDCELNDIRLTGLDNGLISFERIFGTSGITDEEFYELMTKYTMSLKGGDGRLVLYEVTGNTGIYSYGTQYVNDESGKYYAFKGGFLQGFYKLYGFNYQTLPQYIENTWNLEFVLRPRNYENEEPYVNYSGDTKPLNLVYPENKGIFFYMGTRAENKFAQFYISDIDEYPIRPEYKKLCEEGEENICDNNDEVNKQRKKHTEQLSRLEELWLLTFLYRPFETDDGIYTCGCQLDIDYNTILESLSEDLDASNFDIEETSEGRPIKTDKYFEIPTDNKYLLFNRARNGFTTKTFNDDPDIEYVLTGITKDYKTNQYLLFNRTKNGYTTHNIGDYFDSDEYKNDKTGAYKITKDIVGNAFALKVNDDGSIGYRYLVKDCDSASGYTIEEETSFSGIIKDDEWNVVNVMFSILNGEVDNCGIPFPYPRRRMRIYIYVNGYLKLVSKEVPEFDFHELDDTFDKQEGVPFNISLGGGSQGLMESMWTNRKRPFKYILPIEENFAGTFMGDIRSFKFYTCRMESAQIKNNYLYEIRK